MPRAQNGWTNLFDGKTLKGWKQVTGQRQSYTVENRRYVGVIGTTIANHPNSFLVTEKEYGDFILKLDIKS